MVMSITCYKKYLATRNSNSGCYKLLLADRIDFELNNWRTPQMIFINLVFWSLLISVDPFVLWLRSDTNNGHYMTRKCFYALLVRS